ncbi:ABC transporter permease [Azospirillum doebereinerae]
MNALTARTGGPDGLPEKGNPNMPDRPPAMQGAAGDAARGWWGTLSDRAGAGLFLMPLTLFMFLVFLVPLGIVVATSLYDEGFTGRAYTTFATGRLFHQALLNTFSIGALTGLTAVVFGYVIAYHLSRVGRRQRALLMILVMLPFWTSILVKSFAFTVILGKSGIVNNALQALFGSAATVDLLFNRVGVIVGLTHWLLPFAVFPILNSLLAQDRSLREAAEVMGAGPVRIFWKVTFPLSLPGVFAGGLMSAVIAMGSFVTPALLGGRGDLMMANLVDFYIRESLDWTMASAIAVVLLLIAGALIAVLARTRGASSLRNAH